MNIFDIQRPTTHPGETLREEYLTPLNISQSELARHIGVSFRAVNEIVNEKRGVTPEMALRLAKAFNTTPQFWLNLQNNYEISKNRQKWQGIAEIKSLCEGMEA